jgi:hypothetical protein
MTLSGEPGNFIVKSRFQFTGATGIGILARQTKGGKTFRKGATPSRFIKTCDDFIGILFWEKCFKIRPVRRFFKNHILQCALGVEPKGQGIITCQCP